MNRRFKRTGISFTVFVLLQCGVAVDLGAQHEDKPRPEAWKDLVYGARFMDRIGILIFDGKANGISDRNFAGKLLGKTNEGKLLFGYARLPGY